MEGAVGWSFAVPGSALWRTSRRVAVSSSSRSDTGERDSLLRRALLNAAEECRVPLETKIAGPSNIGNYLAGLGIAATAGFGVDYVGVHGTDERVRLDTIPVVQAVCHNAIVRLLGGAG